MTVGWWPRPFETFGVHDTDLTSRAMHTSGTVGGDDDKIVAVLPLAADHAVVQDSAARIPNLTGKSSANPASVAKRGDDCHGGRRPAAMSIYTDGQQESVAMSDMILNYPGIIHPKDRWIAPPSRCEYFPEHPRRNPASRHLRRAGPCLTEHWTARTTSPQQGSSHDKLHGSSC